MTLPRGPQPGRCRLCSADVILDTALTGDLYAADPWAVPADVAAKACLAGRTVYAWNFGTDEGPPYLTRLIPVAVRDALVGVGARRPLYLSHACRPEEDE